MAKRLSEQDVETTHTKANRKTSDWKNLLTQDMYDFVSLYTKSNNLPITFVMGCLIPITAGLCGPGSSISTNQLKNPLNIYVINIGEPGCGKSRAHKFG